MRECETCQRCFTNETVFCPDDGVQTKITLIGEPTLDTLDARYQLEQRLAKGSLGVVFKARHLSHNTTHAIKVIMPYFVGDDATLLARFRQQAQVAAGLHHQNIVAVTDLGVMSKTMPFLVMEFLDGKSLQDILAEEKVMTPPRALEFIEVLAAALGAAHYQNVVHFDLKPSNIFAQDQMPLGEGLKILDFGLTKIVTTRRLGELVRSYRYWKDSFFYMAPELWTNQEPDARADIYSLGAILYQMLTGRVPFQGSPAELMEKHLAMPPPRFKSLGVKVSPQVEEFVRRALQKDVSARPQSMKAFLGEFGETMGRVYWGGRPDAASYEMPPRKVTWERPPDSLAYLITHNPPGFVGAALDSGEARAAQLAKEIEEAQEAEREWRTEQLLRKLIGEGSDLRPEIAPEVRPDSERLPETTILTGRTQEAETPRYPYKDSLPQVIDSKPAAETPIYLDENVQFTVYKPKRILPQKWYTLLAYAHLSERRPGEDEADPIERMEAEAERIIGEQKIDGYARASEDSSQAVPRRGEITFLPFMPGVEFNPPSQSFLWQESVHGQEFRMLASAALDGKTVRGQMSVFLGSILLAEINLSLRVDSAQVPDAEQVPLEKEKPARPYRKVFPSYSHKDIEIVAQIEEYAQISGDKYLRDVNELRSGQNWKQWMRETIEEADIFQLFWSTNSMRSQNVKLEWQHALRLGRQNFIRPTYWENPLPQSPADNLPPAELLDLHFQQVRAPGRVSFTPPLKTLPGAGVVRGEEPPAAVPPFYLEPQESESSLAESTESSAPLQVHTTDSPPSTQPMGSSPPLPQTPPMAPAGCVAGRSLILLLAIGFVVLVLSIGLLIILFAVFR